MDKERRRMQCGEGDEEIRKEKDNEASHTAERSESHQNENVASVGAGVEEEEEGKLNSSDTVRGRRLPPGMKLKKRVSAEERNSPKANGVEKMTDQVQDKAIENHTKPGETEKTNSAPSVKAVHPEKTNQTSQDPHKDSPQQPTDGESCLVEHTDPAVKEGVSKSSSSSSTQASRDSDCTRDPTSNKLAQSTESSQTKNQQDDDDVVLVSVEPATRKTPPASAVQKTLTTFPGFQPASKVKCPQQDPKRLHSLLTAQLQQKKVSSDTLWKTWLARFWKLYMS